MFADRLAEAVLARGPLAVGLDPHPDRLPAELAEVAARGGAAGAEAALAFGEAVIDAVADVAAALKVQVAFFEALGAPGWAAMERLVRRARDAGLLVVADAKRGDVSSTAAAYARAFLDPAGPVAADALTVSPWLGVPALAPFVEWCDRAGRGLFVLVRTTAPGGERLQLHGDPPAAHVLAEELEALGASRRGRSGLSPIGAVVGARAEARALRARIPSAWFLVPGVGAQGGRPDEALAGAREDGLGVLVAAARSVLFPPEGREADLAAARAGIRQRARALAAALRAQWRAGRDRPSRR